MCHPNQHSLTFRFCLTVLSAALLGFPGNVTAQNQEPHYDPTNGFKPAQTSLTAIFRQLAASLEHHGHPGPYLRHILAEHDRIAAKYREKLGKEMVPYLPDYMTAEYVEKRCIDWDKFAPNLKLERLAKTSGHNLRLAIDGENGKGTSLVLLFNWHQDRVYEDMTAKGKRTIGFQQLKEELVAPFNPGRY